MMGLFNAKTFLKEGRTKGYVIHASDGKPFLVKYNELLIKEGKPCCLVIWLVDPNADEKDISSPIYVSETFYHFFRPQREVDDASLDARSLSRRIQQSMWDLCLDDSGLIVAEIKLEADEGGLLYLIDDLNYRHIPEIVFDKYYASFRGQYDHIGQSMVGIAGRVLKEGYGISFLGVKTDKTKGFYWVISGHPPKKPFIPIIISKLELIGDIKKRKEIRENIYMNIIRKIIMRRFDPYLSNGYNVNLEDAWKSHCVEIRRILADNKFILSWLLDESRDPMTSDGIEKLIDSMMADYKAKNFEWFKSINDGMRKLIKAHEAGDKSQRNRILDEIMIMEEDPVLKKGLENLKKSEMTIDILGMIHETLRQLGRIFPIFDLNRIDEMEIGIELHIKS